MTTAGDRFAAGRNTDEDVVFDMLDILAGWCSLHARIDARGRVDEGPHDQGERMGIISA